MKILQKAYFILFLFTTFHVSSQKAKDFVNLSYGNHSQQTLDLFLPKSYTAITPVIIMIHGGGWMMGGKEYTDKRSKDLRDRGFIVANIDYRYVSESVHCKDLLSDIDNAIAYVESISKEKNFSHNGYHLAGISAGAHLSLLYGYTSTRKIKSISALCAPSKFDNKETYNHIKNLGLIKNIEFLADANYTADTANMPKFKDIGADIYIKHIPTLLVHGTKDELVNYKQSVDLYDRLQTKKVKSKLVTMKDKGHDVGLNEPVSEKEVYDEITNWINLYN